MEKERSRYERKGFGLFFATLIAICFFWGVPQLGRLYWGSIMETKEAWGLNYTYFFLAWSVC